MAVYIFSNPDNPDEKVEVIQSVHDKHEFIDSNGQVWNREYTVPNHAIDTSFDPHNPKDFVRNTSKKGTVGELFDRAGEWSEKRGGSTGKDEVKDKFYTSYAKRRNNRVRHPDVIKSKAKEKLDKMGVVVEE